MHKANNKDTYTYNEGAPNRRPLNNPINSHPTPLEDK